MSVIKLSCQFLRNNMRNYKFYLLVITVTVAIFYNFLALAYNPSVASLADTYMYAQIAAVLCMNILFLVVIFFMWHSNHFFFKQREKETGLYMLMGVPTSKIGKVFAVESVVLGLLAFAIGLPLGILTSKLFFMLLAKAMVIEVVLPFAIPVAAIRDLVLVFASLFLIMGFYNYRAVCKSRLIDLIQGAKREQQVPKLKYMRGIIGILLIAVGYFLSLKGQGLGINLMSVAIIVLWFVCIGTYFFFGSVLSIVLSRLIAHKKLIYKGERLISLSNTLFRLQNNYKNLAMTTILCAATVTAFTTSLAVKTYADHNLLIEVPYSLNYLGRELKTKKQVQQIIQSSPHQILGQVETEFLLLDKQGHIMDLNELDDVAVQKVIADKNYGYMITSVGQIQKILECIDYPQKDKLLKQLACESGEMTLMLSPGIIGSTISSIGEVRTIQGKSYKIKNESKVPFIGNIGPLSNTFGYVLNDVDYMKVKGEQQGIINNGINISDQEECLPLLTQLVGTVPGGESNLNNYMGHYLYKYKLVGSFYFLGLIISIVFMLATFSTLYFKVLSDAFSDRQQYTMLKKIGMTEQEILKSIYMQIGIAFVLPAVVGACHAFMANQVFEKFVKGNYLMDYLTALGLFIALMIVYYIGMSKKYFRLIFD
ncbi:MAG: FtsX-like permease family protein [Niameybacter sp.]